MSDVGKLLGELEKAIRVDYDARISALEEERDARIVRVREAMGENGTRGGGTSKKTPRLRAVKSSGSSAKGGKADAPGKSTRLSDESRKLIEWMLSQESQFTSAMLSEAFPEISGALISYHCRNLVSRGELKLVTKGASHHPAVYAPLPFNSLRPRGRAAAS